MTRDQMRALRGTVLVPLVVAVALFGCAGTVGYWQGWVFLAVYVAGSVGLTLYLMVGDPALLARRMRGGPMAEGRPAQKIVMWVASAGFAGLVVVPGLDRRFGWSGMAGGVAVAGDVAMLLGWVAVWVVFRANSFASATIEVAAAQTVVSTGPYGVVRHPMYAGGLLLLAGIPVALGSWWGLLALAAVLPALVWRLLDEERMLAAELAGYNAYQSAVRWRLMPGIW